MSRNILIGTLGTSPGIVTCTLDCFLEKHTPPIQFDKIILVTTNNEKVIQGYDDLKEHLDRGSCPICKRYSGLTICLDTVGVPEILTEADNNAILAKILGHLRREHGHLSQSFRWTQTDERYSCLRGDAISCRRAISCHSNR